MGRRHVTLHLLVNGRTDAFEDTGKRPPALAGVFISGPKPLLWTTASLGGELFAAGCDDPSFFHDFGLVFGGGETSPDGPDPRAATVVRVVTASTLEGHIRVQVIRDGEIVPTRDYLIGLDGARSPFRVIEMRDGWTVLTNGETEGAALLVRDDEVAIPLCEDWRLQALTLAFRSVFGVREDAIFFHAASVAIDGRGALFAGPRRAGKSTTTLALAARGHTVLGDDIAWYEPATNELRDFRRPIGVREGPRARVVDEVMAALGPREEFRDSVRVPLAEFVPVPAESCRVPLVATFVIRGFADEPRAERIQPQLAHAPLLQPITLSLLNTSPGRRLLQVVRLLAAVPMYDLHLGQPDKSAKFLEELLESHASQRQ